MELKQYEIIQILRRRSDMNQGTLGSKAFNTSYESGRTKIKNIELGKQIPTQDDLEKMARVLGVSSTDLTPNASTSILHPLTGKEGILIHQKTIDRFPQLAPYLDMLNKAVALNDQELIEHIGEKIAVIVQTFSNHKDESAVNR
ncbi:MAG: helix-turn-helix transcriptional regulator [Desulfobacterales bacterium]|nr:helix-turn-helix transcriptional regulator [Desulfobacterales bacterium]